MGRGTLAVVSAGSGSLRRGQGQVGGPTRASGTFWGTLPMVTQLVPDLPEGPPTHLNPLGGTRRVRGPSGRSGTSRGTIGEVLVGSGEHL